jgi:hypothetical protein
MSSLSAGGFPALLQKTLTQKSLKQPADTGGFMTGYKSGYMPFRRRLKTS